MKFILTFTLSALVASFGSINANAQSSINQAFQKKIAEKNVPRAQLGSLVCENAEGTLVLCSGTIEETVAGVVTNAPYITLNKPASPNASKSIFSALVSADAGAISKGDFLTAGSNGTLVHCDENKSKFAYAIALDDLSGQGMIRVKVLTK